MFESEDLKNHIESSSTVKSKAFIVAEWNLNDPENVQQLGNYRHRWTYANSYYKSLNSQWDISDNGSNATHRWWKDATNCDDSIEGAYDNDDEPTIFIEEDVRFKYLFSLDDCIKPHRPRSGINYPLYFDHKYFDGLSSVERPRYYVAHKDNYFKYWTSYRKVVDVSNSTTHPPASPLYSTGIEEFTDSVGISRTGNDVFYIHDACPFVVYKERVPANKLVVKMQTNIGTIKKDNTTDILGNAIDDPLYGDENSTRPRNWAVQVLKGNLWTTVKEFGENETRADGSPIVGPDGYVELVYGLLIPDQYSGPFRFLGTVVNTSLLPDEAVPGDYMYVVADENSIGSGYIYTTDLVWEAFAPQYGWKLNDNYDYIGQYLLTDFTNPSSYTVNGSTVYREFEYIEGIRLVVKTMNRVDSTFDLIEMSPRLQVDLTDSVVSFDVKKATGSVDDIALPVGGLQAGTGSVEIFDFDNSFRENNDQSIISGLMDSNITFSFYELIETGNTNYYVPIKKMHTESKPPNLSDVATVKYELRDSFYIFENVKAPSIMLTQTSLSYAVAAMLDLIGFSNYTFRFDSDYPEPTIPYFFVGPDQNVAEVLQKLALATQTAMFFDEYNNFVVMSKEYLMGSRDASLAIDGDSSVPNLVEIASSEKKVYNSGTINYTERYLQRSVGSLSTATSLNRDINWIYTPALLWEVSGDEATRTINDKVATQSAYALGALPLNSDLTAVHPTVSNRKIINNVVDLGDNVYWLPRYNGYLYANGEIIKFDAVQYSVQGRSQAVWISSNDEYQKYFATLPFNGKMYPTGFVRIYAEPYYEQINGVEYLKNGAVAKSGRAQFGTTITSHSSGLNAHWSSEESLRGLRMNSNILFEGEEAPDTVLGATGVATGSVQSSIREGIIKNFMRDVNDTDASNINLSLANRGMIQASAFVFEGPKLSKDQVPRDYISYVYKSLDTNFKHFGTRMRIIGKLESASDVDQSASGSMSFYTTDIDSESVVLTGGAGGIGIGVNPVTNNGYFLELVALSNTNLSDISGSENEDANAGVHNIIFYKVVKNSNGNTDKAIPIKLWGGLANVLVDSGTFVGQQRTVTDDNATVYDVSIEWKDIGPTRRFYLYVNGQQIATVDDTRPIPLYSNLCLFVRGGSRLMFENVYALRQAVSQNINGDVVADNILANAFGKTSLSTAGFRKYGISGFVQQSYLSGLSPNNAPSYNMYYDEFGTIMREAAYFDVKFDKAYPALTAQISPPLNEVPGYTVSGFEATPYAAKFLIFNTMDKAITLDETSGNYLRIQGITFTQNTTHEYKMDDYFNEVSNLADPQTSPSNVVLRSPRTAADKYKNIKINRSKYGVSEWSIDSDYIQSQNSALNLMSWLVNKTTRPRQLIGMEIFNNPLVQLGDVITVSYTKDGVETFTSSDKKFVVYNIEYSRGTDGPTTKIYGSEV